MRLLQGQLALAGGWIDDIYIFVAAAIEIAFALIFADIHAERETLLRSKVDGAHRLIGQPEEFLGRRRVSAEIAEVLVGVLLHLLLSLQARIFVVPDDHVGQIGLIGRRAGLGGRSIVADSPPHRPRRSSFWL